MKLLWTFAKVVLALALVIPISIIVLSTALGILGALVGLAFFALRLAVLGLCAWGVFSLARMLFGGRRRGVPQPTPLPAQRIDPYYEAAKRELDQELGDARG